MIHTSVIHFVHQTFLKIIFINFSFKKINLIFHCVADRCCFPVSMFRFAAARMRLKVDWRSILRREENPGSVCSYLISPIQTQLGLSPDPGFCLAWILVRPSNMNSLPLGHQILYVLPSCICIPRTCICTGRVLWAVILAYLLRTVVSKPLLSPDPTSLTPRGLRSLPFRTRTDFVIWTTGNFLGEEQGEWCLLVRSQWCAGVNNQLSGEKEPQNAHLPIPVM